MEVFQGKTPARLGVVSLGLISDVMGLAGDGIKKCCSERLDPPVGEYEGACKWSAERQKFERLARIEPEVNR